MSTPKNHHYVSQVLSKNIKQGDNPLYRYCKINGWYKTVVSTKSLFSQDYLNSTVDEEGNIEHSSVERILNENFEKDFPKHYQTILDVAYATPQPGKALSNSHDINTALEYLIGMGIIGQERHPEQMEENGKAVFEILETLANIGTEKMRKDLQDEIERVSHVKNKAPINFGELSKDMLKLMEPITCSICIAPKDHYFFLPDCTAAVQRFPLPPDVVFEGELLQNPGRPIGLVIMPINSKILISIISSRLLPDKRPNGIYYFDEVKVKEANEILFDCAFKEIACENQDYLKTFIDTKKALGN